MLPLLETSDSHVGISSTIMILMLGYRIAQNSGGENFGEFGKSILFHQCFTLPNLSFNLL